MLNSLFCKIYSWNAAKTTPAATISSSTTRQSPGVSSPAVDQSAGLQRHPDGLQVTITTQLPHLGVVWLGCCVWLRHLRFLHLDLCSLPLDF